MGVKPDMSLCDCDNCGLKGEPVAFEVGNPDTVEIVFVGEAPGATEATKGTPFVGESGRIIRDVVKFLGIPQESVYFTNMCICRPPQNRTPVAKEIKCCMPRLEQEIRFLSPSLVVALGLTPTKNIFKGVSKMEDGRGKIQDTIFGIPGIPTYHPAALLYPKGDTKFLTLFNDVKLAWESINGIKPQWHDIDTVVSVVATREQGLRIAERVDSEPDNVVIIDWETEGTKPIKGAGRCVGVCLEVGEAFIIPDYFFMEHRDVAERILGGTLCAFNAPFDRMFNKVEGFKDWFEEDPMHIHALLDERPQRRSLENLAVAHAGAEPYESQLMKRYNCSKSEMFDKIPLPEIYMYCGLDVDYTRRLYLQFKEELESKDKLHNVYQYLIIPAVNTLPEVSQNGLWLDEERWRSVEEDYRTQLEDLTGRIREVVGDDTFNPNSHPQVQEYVWDDLGLPEPYIYGRKERSVDKKTRKALLQEYDEEFVVVLDEYKELYTMWSRYLRDVPKYRDSDGRVRCQYHLDRTLTGRLSTTDPALHQIPRESTIRSIYGAPPGRVLVQADHEQIEMRMAAHVAKDRELTNLFHRLRELGTDFHSYMASTAYEVELEEVTKSIRQSAKPISFGILYLMSDKGLAKELGKSPKEAYRVIQNYKSMMPGVIEWIEVIKSQVKNRRFVESPFGRRRRFPLVTRKNLNELYREAVNMPIQSGASDLTLSNVVTLHRIFKEHMPEVFIVLTVHDSIYIECPENLAEDVSKITREVMETPPFDTEVPFYAEIKVGRHWAA